VTNISQEKEQEEQRIRLVSPEPRLAQFLKQRKVILFPELNNYVTKWIEDVGVTLRSHDYHVGFMASSFTHGSLMFLSRTFPILTKFGIVSEALGLTG